MKPLTQLWIKLTESLSELSKDELFNIELFNDFGEIFDLKDVEEYKAAMYTDCLSPSQYKHTSNAIRKAFVEGYMLAGLEQKKRNIKHLYNCYNQEIEKPEPKKRRRKNVIK